MPRSNTTFIDLRAKLATYMNEQELVFIERAYDRAFAAHEGVKRESGEPYIEHPLAVAMTLANFSLDSPTIAASLLHDVVEDTKVSLSSLEREFGKEVSCLVAGVTKLQRVRLKPSFSFLPSFFQKRAEEARNFERQVESLRKMLLAMTTDIRVIFIKLADRLHNMQTLDAVRPDKRARIAQETLEIYAPLANRLGMGSIKGQLEDLAFPYVYPHEYKDLHDRVGGKLTAREVYVLRFQKILTNFLQKEGVPVSSVHGRAKHLYSLWRKLQRYDGDLSKIYDLVAVRIIVPTVADCYQTLGLLHSRWNPLIGRIKDYIATPKPNGYQSLHTTIFGPDGEIVEIQIRTTEMHDLAERGIAAHWHYSESKHAKKVAERESRTKLEWLEELHKWQASLKDPNELKRILSLDFFSDQIFVFTPQGDVIKLPAKSTPIDFAYAIHSDVGNACTGAKIDGKIVPLDTKLDNGDIVEIMTAKNPQGPKRDWLTFVQTQKARSHIKVYHHLS